MRGAQSFVGTLALVVLAVCAARPEASEPLTPQRRSDRAPSRLAVTVSLDPEGIRARFAIDRPVRDLVFSQIDHVNRDAWTIITPGFALVDGKVTAEHPFETFEILLGPDTAERDRIFPSVTRVGGGLVLYGPALDVAGLSTTLAMIPPEDGVAWPPANALSGYAYLGPAAEIGDENGMRVIGGATVAPWLASSIRDDARASLSFYAQMLGRPAPVTTILVTGDSPGPMTFHGDVTDNAVIFLRFHGAQWQSTEPGPSDRTARFVRHEAFHLWNRNNAPGTPPWLHEGGAEYAAIVAAVQANALSHAQALGRLSSHLTACRRELHQRPMRELDRTGSAVYDCGVAAQWLADVEARSESGGRHNTFSLWSELLRRGGDSGGYALADFRELTGSLVATLLDAPAQPRDPDRWATLTTALADHGVVVSETPNEEDVRSATVQHLLALHCNGGPRGFWTDRGTLRLDSGENCGALSGNPEIVGIQGHDLFDGAMEAFNATQNRCSSGQTVSLQRPAGEDIVVSCEAPLLNPPVFRLQTAPPLSIDANRP